MNKRRYMLRAAIAAAVAILASFRLADYSGAYAASYGAYGFFGGAVFTFGADNFVFAILALLPLYALGVAATDYFSCDFASCCVYLFTRSKSRAVWTLKKAAGLFLLTAFFFLLVTALFFAICTAKGVKLDGAALLVCAEALPLWILFAYTLLLPACILAVRTGATAAFIAETGVLAALLTAAMLLPRSAASLTPFAQAVLAFHDTPFKSQAAACASVPIAGFRVWFSFTYLFAVIAAELAIIIPVTNKMELLSVPEGEN